MEFVPFCSSADHLLLPSKTSFVPPGGRLSLKVSPCQYRDPHVKEKTVSRPSYLNMGIPIPWKDGLRIETGPRLLFVRVDCRVCCLTKWVADIPVPAPVSFLSSEYTVARRQALIKLETSNDEDTQKKLEVFYVKDICFSSLLNHLLGNLSIPPGEILWGVIRPYINFVILMAMITIHQTPV